MPNLHLVSHLFLLSLLTGCASFEKTSNDSANPNKTQMSAAVTLSAQRAKVATTDIEKHYEQAKTENYTYHAPGSWEDTNRKIEAMQKIVRQFEPDNQRLFGGPSEKTVMTAIQQVQSSTDKAGEAKRHKNTQ